MKYIVFFLIFIINTSYADPFYQEENSQQNDVFAEKSEKTTACMPESPLEKLILETRFEQLKFIGVIEIAEKKKALFMDGEHKIVDFTKDLLIFPSMVEIKHIDLKGIKYIDWANSTDCLNPIWITKNL